MEPDAIKKLKEVPFYKGPERVRTSGEIVRDARMSLTSQLMKPLPLSTRRPETPLEDTRRLFRQNSAKDLSHRPPSTFSLGSRNFDPESRPSSGNVRLTPLVVEPKIRSPSSDSDVKVAPKPPPDPNRVLRRTNSRPYACQPLSGADLEALSDLALSRRRSESLKDVSDLQNTVTGLSDTAESQDESSRRVRSGPKERTRSLASEDRTPFEPILSEGHPVSARKYRNDHRVRGGTLEESQVTDGNQRHETGSGLDSSGVQKMKIKTGNEIKGRPDRPKGKTSGDSMDRMEGEGTIGRGASEPHRRMENATSSIPAARTSSQVQKNESSGPGHLPSKKSSSAARLSSAERHKTASDDDGGGGATGDGYYESAIVPVLSEMASLAQNRNVGKLIELSTRLYQLLEKGNLLGRSCKQRSYLLKCIYQLLDLDSPQLLLNLARLILALKVTGKNLLNVCKLIFAVSKESQNDNLFLQDNILDLLVETARVVGVDYLSSSVDSRQTLIYCLGSLKFLSSNTSLLKFLASKSHLNSFAQMFASINRTGSASGVLNDLTDILVQLTAVLRNLANVSGNKQYFLSFGLVDEICAVLTMLTNEQELMYNVSGLLSKLTLHSNCCESVSKNPVNFKSLLELLVKFKPREELVLRVAFILGNLLAKHENARNFLFSQPNALGQILDVYEFYFDKDMSQDVVSSESAARSQKKFEDVVIKTVRVIANASISQEIGEEIAKSDKCIELLLRVLEQKTIDSSEELVLNVMVTINNLSFYSIPESAIVRMRLPIAQALLNFLEVKNTEGLAESTRVLGNLTREKDVRDYLVRNKVDEAMVAMLDSGNRELVFASCGVLINLMVDDEKRALLANEGGVTKLIGVLQEFGRSDWQLAGMVCQTLWNFSAKITSATSCFGEDESQDIVDILTEYLEDENIMDGFEDNDNMRDYYLDTWKAEFCPVASDLLRRILENQSHLEPLSS